MTFFDKLQSLIKEGYYVHFHYNEKSNIFHLTVELYIDGKRKSSKMLSIFPEDFNEDKLTYLLEDLRSEIRLSL